jgi:hypothetical protein
MPVSYNVPFCTFLHYFTFKYAEIKTKEYVTTNLLFCLMGINFTSHPTGKALYGGCYTTCVVLRRSMWEDYTVSDITIFTLTLRFNMAIESMAVT